MKPKEALYRIVKRNGVISVDESGKADGRGAYICKSAACIAAVRKKRGIEKAFRMQTPDEIYTVLEVLSSNLEVQ